MRNHVMICACMGACATPDNLIREPVAPISNPSPIPPCSPVNIHFGPHVSTELVTQLWDRQPIEMQPFNGILRKNLIELSA